MKNKLHSISFALVLSLALSFGGCSKDTMSNDPDSCIEHAEAVTTALNNYIADPTVDNCRAYVGSLRNYLDGNACFTNAFYGQYKEALEELEADDCQ